ncbi:RNA-directed DNA polymerase, eukaryota [Tanacetum coccineum]
MKKKVGNGVHTSFWEEPWLSDISLMHAFPRLYALESNKQVTVAAKLSEGSLTDSFRRAPCGGIEEEQLFLLVNKLESVILANSNDRWIWSLESSGEFSVKSPRSYIDNTLLPIVGSSTRWVKVAPIKINIFAWKVCLDKLPTRLNLSLRGIDIPSIICPICSSAEESGSHLLFGCNMARLLLRKVARWWELEYPDLNSYEIGLLGLSLFGFIKVLKMCWKVSSMLCGGRFGNSVIMSCLAALSLVWIFFLMRLFFYLLLGVLVDVKIILIGSLG